jgi:iron complex outermembrane receptor protein
VNGNYVANLDTRTQVTLDNCVLDGVDPTQLGLLATTGISTRTGGNPDAQAETSDSLTLGAVYSNSFGDDIDFDLAVTYFDIEVNDTLEEADAATILQACYNNLPGLADPNCARISRTGNAPANNTIALVDASFVNIGLITSTGFDVNARMRMPLDMIGPNTDLSLIFNAAHYTEQLRSIDPSGGAVAIDDLAGTIGNPQLLAQFSTVVDQGNWSGRWRTRYQSDGQQLRPDALADPTVGGTRTACDLLGVNLRCRDVDFVDDYFTHDASLTYTADEWDFAIGINNIFDEAPPLIDQGEGPSRMNMVTQSGYDLIGRRIFVSFGKRF